MAPINLTIHWKAIISLEWPSLHSDKVDSLPSGSGNQRTSRRAKKWSDSSEPNITHWPMKRVVKGSRITLTIKAANWVIIEVNNTWAQLLVAVNCPWQYWTILLNTSAGMFPRILNINKIGSWHPVTCRPRSTIENSPIRSHTERLIDTLEQLTKDEDLRPDTIIIGEFNERLEEDMDIDYDFVKLIRVHYIWNLFDWLRCECDERDMGDIIVTLCHVTRWQWGGCADHDHSPGLSHNYDTRGKCITHYRSSDRIGPGNNDANIR